MSITSMQVLYPTTSTDYAYNITSGNAASDQNASIYGTVPSASTTIDTNCKDGKDDGKIGFFDKLGNMVKGAVSSVGNAIKGILTDPGKLLKTAALVGACFIPVIGPVIAGGLAIVGAAKGIGTIIQGAQMVNAAETDEQAAMAWQNIGAGTLQTALCVVPAGKALKSAAGAVKGATSSAIATAKSAISSTKGMTLGEIASTTGTAAKTAASNAYTSVKSTATNAFNTVKNVKVAETASTFGTTVKSTATNAYSTVKNANFGEIASNVGTAARNANYPHLIFGSTNVGNALKTQMDAPVSVEEWVAAGKPIEAYSPYYNIDFDFDTASIVSDMNKLQMQQSMINASV